MKPHMDIEAILARSDFFRGISKAGQTALASICVPKTAAKGEQLFHEGDAGLCVYLLVQGSVQVYKSRPDGRDIVIKIIKPGEIFAEVILFELDGYPASAMSLRTSLLFMVPKQQFHRLLDNDNFRNDFIAALMRKQRYLAGRISSLSSSDVHDRFIAFMDDHFGRQRTIVPEMSKKDIAAAIGTTPETLSRLLARLHEEKLLEWNGRSITVSPQFWSSKSS